MSEREVKTLDIEPGEDTREYHILGWIDKYEIKNEKGDPITFDNHLFLLDIYEDQSQNLVVTKAAQVGLSTLEILKNIYDANSKRMDIIYTLPTDNDVNIFVAGKVNRIIINNPILLQYTADQDSIEQKRIGPSMLYFRGTWTKKAAIMVTADRLVHDEKDSSKQEVVSDYQARMQASKFRQTHVFSHPSTPGNGVDVEWKNSNQREWFIKCPHCDHEQYLTWNLEDSRRMSIDIEKRIFVCKKCRGELGRKDRAIGRWVPKYTDKLPGGKPITYSGYHVSLLMCPWVTAGEIIDKYYDPKRAPEYFNNKVLGIPYSGSGNVVTQDMIQRIITKEKNLYQGRLVIGVDTGVALRYVVGNKQGLVGYGEMKDYMPDDVNKLPLDQTLEYYLIKFPQSIMVIDQGGDIIGSRKLKKKYPGRVFLCHYARDRKTMQLIRWGEKDEFGNVLADRNRMIQLVIDEMREKRYFLYNGDENAWYDYWLHWSHIYRTAEENSLNVIEYTWHRNDRDDWVHATVYWRIGIDRFGGVGAIVGAEIKPEPNSYMINPNQTVDFSPNQMFSKAEGDEAWWESEETDDWRSE